MDNSPYPIAALNGISTPDGCPSPTPFSPHRNQQGSPSPRMLLPLQSFTTSTHPLYSGSQRTLRTETTDALHSPYELSHSYNHSSQTAARHDVDWSAQDNCAPHTSYGASQPMMPSATTAASPPQLIATTPAAGRRLRVLRPKAPGGPMEHRDVGSHGPVPPSSVFGSRGRRGMLPLAPGRPAAPAIGILAAENIFIPIKNTEGRFPCPHCTKDYMHAKHLKRHLLRRKSLHATAILTPTRCHANFVAQTPATGPTCVFSASTPFLAVTF